MRYRRIERLPGISLRVPETGPWLPLLPRRSQLSSVPRAPENLVANLEPGGAHFESCSFPDSRMAHHVKPPRNVIGAGPQSETVPSDAGTPATVSGIPPAVTFTAVTS
jgi:hypothetical protein